MRLIDADKLKEEFSINDIDISGAEVLSTISLQTTSYDIKNVEKQLIKAAIEEDEACYVNGDEIAYLIRLDSVLEIVKAGGVNEKHNAR